MADFSPLRRTRDEEPTLQISLFRLILSST